VSLALGRKVQRPLTQPVTTIPHAGSAESGKESQPDLASVIARLRDAGDWNKVPSSPEEQAQAAARILDRARAADSAARLTHPTSEVIDLLEERVRNRSLHPNWRYHGLDGASALRALFELKSDRAVPLAQFCLMRDDPDLAKVQNPMFKTPRSWV